LSHGSE